MADTLLDVVNENDEVIGQELRSVIHAKGLLHREIHVWFITPQKEIILQRRSMKKEISPGVLTVAAGGHVESGATYEQSALLETQEETSVVLLRQDLHYLTHYKADDFYKEVNLHNRAFRHIFGAVFKGSMDDLKVEKNDGDGFIKVPLQHLLHPSEDLKKQIAPRLIEGDFMLVYKQLEQLVA